MGKMKLGLGIFAARTIPDMRRFGDISSFTSKWKTETKVSGRAVLVFDPETPVSEVLVEDGTFDQIGVEVGARLSTKADFTKEFLVLEHEAPETLSLVGLVTVTLAVEAEDPEVDRVKAGIFEVLSGCGFDVTQP